MKTFFALAMAFAGIAAALPAFAEPSAQKASDKGAQTVLIHRPSQRYGTDRVCQNPLDWRCDNVY
jgi:hypothetical protein